MAQSKDAWPQFRGPNRDGRVTELPQRLPDLQSDLLWTHRIAGPGVGGIATSHGIAIISGRTGDDLSDEFTALSLDTGKPLWTQTYPAEADLDYGNSPRATPLVQGNTVVTLGATGVLTAWAIKTGQKLWQLNLTKRFQAELPTWGFCGSPISDGESVFLQVSKQHGLVSIDLQTGETNWSVPGNQVAYSSLTPLGVGDQHWVAGVDHQGYFVRDIERGDLVWDCVPEYDGDFGVPAPVFTGDHLVITSENNGILAYPIDPESDSALADSTARETRTLSLRPVVHDELFPESHTPTLAGRQLLVAFEGLHGLDLDDGLRQRWSVAEDLITNYASVIASHKRALVMTDDASLILVEFDGSSARVVDHYRLTDQRVSTLSHPAIDKNRLIIRIGDEIHCYQLGRPSKAPRSN